METTTLRNQFNSTALQERLAHFPISDKFIPHPRCHSCGHEADHLRDHPPREQSYMKAEKESQKSKKCFPAALEKTLYNSAKNTIIIAYITTYFKAISVAMFPTCGSSQRLLGCYSTTWLVARRTPSLPKTGGKVSSFFRVFFNHAGDPFSFTVPKTIFYFVLFKR